MMIFGFSTIKDDGSWSKPQNIGIPLNNEKHNFVAAIGQSNDELYLQKCL